MSEEKKWVKIKSDDGFTFIVERKVAVASQTLASSLNEDSNFAEALSNTCHIPARDVVAQKVVEYLCHKSQFQNAKSNEEVPDFQERIPPEIALELLMAADYLET
ncbi:POZ domain-containing protein [Clavulina sp. PMI_390]|nr:POZ domain-containing protein [Clavulina sp. PMI_390]